jgi:hypothetical protein
MSLKNESGCPCDRLDGTTGWIVSASCHAAQGAKTSATTVVATDVFFQ